MFGGEVAGGFEFENYGVVDELIGKVFSDNLASVVNGDAGLLFDFEAEVALFDGEGVFVDFLEEAVTEGVAWPERVEG